MFSFVFDVFDTGPRQKEWLRMPRIVAMASGSQNIIRETTRLGPRGRAVASGTAISRIESLLETVIDSITSAEPMSIQVLSRRSVQSRREQALPTRVHFPGRSLHEAQKFGNDPLHDDSFRVASKLMLYFHSSHRIDTAISA